MPTFKELREANIKRQHRVDPHNTIDILFRAVELGGEAGEVLNVVKKLKRELLGMPGKRSTLEALRKEIADVVICADLLAMQMGIDTDSAVQEKFNEKSEELGVDVFL